MTKEEYSKREEAKKPLQAILDENKIDYDKRWGLPKLEELVKNISDKDDKKSIDDKSPKEPQNPVVQELRKNAIMIKEKFDARKNTPIHNLRDKIGRKIYVKVEKENAVEIYEKDTGRFVRAYRKDDQGEDYAKLADVFINTRKGLLK